ncbi:MAG TPA: hypothetical protein VII23_03455 [Terriglobales bacterium]
MSTFFAHPNWEAVVASAVTIVTVLFTVISYIVTRLKELAWRRTEFLCEQSQYLDNDPVLVETITILEGRHPDITISEIFGAETAIDSATRNEYLQKFDKLFNLLWRLCYAHLETKAISRKELEGFGWYFSKISENSSLVEYCENNGFDDINTAIEKLKRFWT